MVVQKVQLQTVHSDVRPHIRPFSSADRVVDCCDDPGCEQALAEALSGDRAGLPVKVSAALSRPEMEPEEFERVYTWFWS